MCHHHLGSRFFKWSPQELHSGYTSLPSYQAWKSVLFSGYPCLCQQFILLTLAFLIKKKNYSHFYLYFPNGYGYQRIKMFLRISISSSEKFIYFLVPIFDWVFHILFSFVCFVAVFFSYLDISGAIVQSAI